MFGQIFGVIGDGFATISNEVNKTVGGFFADRISNAVKTGNEDALKNPVTTAVVLNPANLPVEGVTTSAAAKTEQAVEYVAGGVDKVKSYLPIVALGGLGLLLLSRKR